MLRSLTDLLLTAIFGTLTAVVAVMALYGTPLLIPVAVVLGMVTWLSASNIGH